MQMRTLEKKAKSDAEHKYLGKTLDYTTPRFLRVEVTNNFKAMVEEFPKKIGGRSGTPWIENLFKVDERSKRLGQERYGTKHFFEWGFMMKSPRTLLVGQNATLTFSSLSSLNLMQFCFWSMISYSCNLGILLL